MTINDLRKKYPKSKIVEKDGRFYVYPNVRACVTTTMFDDHIIVEGPNGEFTLSLPLESIDVLINVVHGIQLNEEAAVFINQKQVIEYCENILKNI